MSLVWSPFSRDICIANTRSHQTKFEVPSRNRKLSRLACKISDYKKGEKIPWAWVLAWLDGIGGFELLFWIWTGNGVGSELDDGI